MTFADALRQTLPREDPATGDTLLVIDNVVELCVLIDPLMRPDRAKFEQHANPWDPETQSFTLVRSWEKDPVDILRHHQWWADGWIAVVRVSNGRIRNASILDRPDPTTVRYCMFFGIPAPKTNRTVRRALWDIGIRLWTGASRPGTAFHDRALEHGSVEVGEPDANGYVRLEMLVPERP